MDERLYLHIDLDLFGEHRLIVETLRDLAGGLQRVVDDQAALRTIPSERATRPQLEPAEFTQSIANISTRLSGTFEELEPALRAAISPAGSPELFRLRY